MTLVRSISEGGRIPFGWMVCRRSCYLHQHWLAPWGIGHAIQAWDWFHEFVLVRGFGCVMRDVDDAYHRGHGKGYDKGFQEGFKQGHQASIDAIPEPIRVVEASRMTTWEAQALALWKAEVDRSRQPTARELYERIPIAERVVVLANDMPGLPLCIGDAADPWIWCVEVELLSDVCSTSSIGPCGSREEADAYAESLERAIGDRVRRIAVVKRLRRDVLDDDGATS